MKRFRFLAIALVGLFMALGALSALPALAEVDHNPKFIPLCSVLGDNPGAVECIPDERVRADQELRLWTYASRQLRKCSIVVLDPALEYVAENLGYQCDGVITGAGVIPDEDDAP